jgi:hypothetical protein
MGEAPDCNDVMPRRMSCGWDTNVVHFSPSLGILEVANDTAGLANTS